MNRPLFPPVMAIGILIGLGTGIFRRGDAGSPPPPPASTAATALGDLSDLPPVMRAAFDPSRDFFEPIRPPQPGDWLANQKEPGQPFLAYAGQLARQKRQPGRQRIYILPLGEFGPSSPSLETLRHYTEAFFGKTARILNPVAIDDVPAARRGSALTGNLKLLTTDILNWLPGQMPKDARAILAVTMADLYAGEGWNFVFGQAQIDTGAGVFSFARYDPAFYGQERSEGSTELILRRSCKVLSHEVGHMFGLYHCIYYECVMNGSNHLRETDSRPMHLCPVCLRKLQMGAGFDVQSREISLNAFYQAHRLKPEADWTRRRIERMKKVVK